MAWAPGQTVELRDLCGTRVWARIPLYVVLDTPELVATYLPSGAPMTYVPGPWPTETGEHPWHPQEAWQGHGVLMLQRPDDGYGVWVFWEGPERAFSCWYLNVHDWSRDEHGPAVNDLEIDVVVAPDGTCRLKDAERMDLRVAQGRFSAEDAERALAVAADLVAMVERGETWWDPAWAAWTPPPGWDVG